MARKPGWPCAVLLITGVMALMLGGLALYGRHAVLDRSAFADRATGALAQDEVMDEIATRIAVRELEANPSLAARRPVLEAAVGDLMREPRFPGEFHAGAKTLHDALFGDGNLAVADDGSGTMRVRVTSLVLPGAGRELQAAVAARSPAAARELGPGDPELFSLGGGRLESGLVQAAPHVRRLTSLAPLAILLGVVLLAWAAWRAPTRRLGLRRVALGVALAAGATVAATSIGRAVVLSTFDTSHGDAVVGTIWSAFLEDLRLWALALGALGVIAAAAFEPGAPGTWRRLWATVAAPSGSALRLVRAAGLVLLAALLLWMPEVPLDLALVVAAGLLVFSGAAEVVRLAQRSLIR
ncbi:hypothetical protein OM076_20535 [Solirubrobacter ginsenosidimutans]|uniref:Uncharacterized protein n=1 Tax=Solirubrobacter ginsenosidimutans TaxID=490573 RepID=A0A9X3MUJ8_9ACTN|nr:hypothetical protein [Solirubrobacter ginsenosidimutans]MDA0162672.1 hypothetical protein [Solirubrobacter ginsenosidimutans]